MLPISHIPHEPGIYLFCDAKGKYLYIGKAKNLHKRVQQYFTPGSVWKQDMVRKASSIEYIQTQSESEALFLEDNLIKQHQPPFNSLLKGDNSYGFIKITNEEFSQVFFTRDRRQDGAIYIGPKRYTRQIKDVLHYLRQLLQYRGCKKTQFASGKLCSDYYRGLCRGRCVLAKLKSQNDKTSKRNESLIAQAESQGLEIDHDYSYYHTQYAEIMTLVQDVFEGRQDHVLDHIRIQIDEAVSREHFERAARLRDIYTGLNDLIQRQDVVIDLARDGHVRQVQQIGSWRVWVIATFQQGRLVDIIRQRESIEETSLNELLSLLELEYGDPTLIDTAEYKQFVRTHRDVDRDDREGLITFLTQEVGHGIIGITGQTYLTKDYYIAIADVLAKAVDSYIVSTSRESGSVMSDILETFQQRYFLKSYPYHIECVDISHMGGKHTSGGLSSLQGGVPYTYGYRNYKIQTVSGGDDYGALTELITRRFKLGKSPHPQQTSDTPLEQGGQGAMSGASGGMGYPDLFILDGGLRQLGLIPKLIDQYPEQMQTLMQTTQFAALEKGKGRKRANKKTNPETLHVLLDDGEVVSKSLIYDQVDQLLVQLRDESHRMANKQRKRGMGKEVKEK